MANIERGSPLRAAAMAAIRMFRKTPLIEEDFLVPSLKRARNERPETGTHLCSFDDVAGTGTLFDLTISTDSILYPRKDRVIPLWPEEQGVTAAIASPILARARTMLDLGAGSGVFSLVAARLGCSATAVDCNARALNATRANASRNSIVCDDTVGRLPPGQIRCLPFTIGVDELSVVIDRAGELDPGGFDIVMLNAPYHPTLPGLEPAVHARGGIDGQEAFRSFISAATRLVRPFGWIIGHQMTTVGKGGKISALEELGACLRKLGKGARCAWFFCLEDGITDVEWFIRGIYAGRSGDPLFETYVEQLTKDVSGFALISFRAMVSDYGRLVFRRVPAPTLWYGNHRTWDDRVVIHRGISNSAELG